MAAIIPTLLGAFLQGPVLTKILDLIPDPNKKAEIQVQMAQLAASEEAKQIDALVAQAQQQTDIDKTEAASSDWFARDWRPFIGWVCGSAFAVNYVLGPIAIWVSGLFGKKVEVPPLDMSVMLPVLLGMLGLGAYRTVEKVQGVTK
jgi:hypothetical protein